MPHRITTALGTRFAPPRRPQRMLAVALLAAVLFNQPFLRIFDRGAGTGIAGIPLIYLYLFAAWALVILLMVSVVELRAEPTAAGDERAAGSSSTASVAPAAHEAHRDGTES